MPPASTATFLPSTMASSSQDFKEKTSPSSSNNTRRRPQLQSSAGSSTSKKRICMNGEKTDPPGKNVSSSVAYISRRSRPERNLNTREEALASTESDGDERVKCRKVDPGDPNLSLSYDEDEEAECEDNHVRYREDQSEEGGGLCSPEVEKFLEERDRGKGTVIEREEEEEDTPLMRTVRKRKYYFTQNVADGLPTEKYRTDILERIKSGEEWLETVPYDEEIASLPGGGMISLQDRWREEWNHGIQVPLGNTLPAFKVAPRDIPMQQYRSPYKMPTKYAISSRSVPYYSEQHHVLQAQPSSRLYEGDRLDILWLERLNRSRTAIGLPIVEMSTVLDIMNACEIDCYMYIHRSMLKSLNSPEQDDDAPCDICTLRNFQDDDAMIFCDGCNVCVHLACYGLDQVPRGDWVCRMCELVGYGAKDNLSCVLCPNKKGAMKRCDDNQRWAHVSCALWVPEIQFVIPEKREPISGIERVWDERWTLKCSVCDLRQGACIQCSMKTCRVSYHVTCAQRSGFFMEVAEKSDGDGGIVEFLSYCNKHTKEHKGEAEADVETSDEEEDGRSETLKKLERTFFLHVQHEEIASRLKTDGLVTSDVYEYWKQKRTDNGGRPLIQNAENEITADDKTPILMLPTSPNSAPVISAHPEWEHLLRTDFQRKAFRFQKCYQSADKGRNIVYQQQRREKYKQMNITAAYNVFTAICEFDGPTPISTRQVQSLTDAVQEFMTSEEIAESDRIVEALCAGLPPGTSKKANVPTVSPALNSRASNLQSKRQIGKEVSQEKIARISPAKENKRTPRQPLNSSPLRSSKRRESVPPMRSQNPIVSPTKESSPMNERKESLRSRGGVTRHL